MGQGLYKLVPAPGLCRVAAPESVGQHNAVRLTKQDVDRGGWRWNSCAAKAAFPTATFGELLYGALSRMVRPSKVGLALLPSLT